MRLSLNFFGGYVLSCDDDSEGARRCRAHREENCQREVGRMREYRPKHKLDVSLEGKNRGFEGNFTFDKDIQQEARQIDQKNQSAP